MSFTELSFLTIFLPAALIGSRVPGKQIRETVLLLVSLIFYSLGCLSFLPLLLFSVAVNLLLGRAMAGMEKKRTRTLLFAGGLVFDVLVLAFFKYLPYLAGLPFLSGLMGAGDQAVLLPLGISFYTFKAISYLADIYRGRITPQGTGIRDALYLCFFPQIQSGPLARYGDFESAPSFDLFSEGTYRFMTGFAKKVLLADVLAKITGEIYGSPVERIGIRFAWLGAVCYALQLYYDFSGYSDMAIGISAMLGYPCPENFRYPYMAASFSEFWRRWHITLGAWFRDYVYIPLGGSRVKSRKRHLLNLLAVWLLTGIWHGSGWNFLIWGLSYFLLISAEKLLGLPGRIKSRLLCLLYRIFTLVMVVILWVPFRAGSPSFALGFVHRMFSFGSLQQEEARALFLLKDYWVFILGAVFFSFPFVPLLEKKISSRKAAFYLFETVLMALTAFFFVWGLSLVVQGAYNPFAYANF